METCDAEWLVVSLADCAYIATQYSPPGLIRALDAGHLALLFVAILGSSTTLATLADSSLIVYSIRLKSEIESLSLIAIGIGLRQLSLLEIDWFALQL